MSGAFGQIVNQDVLDSLFLPTPGEVIVRNTLLQMSLIPGDNNIFPFIQLFGPYQPSNNQQRWSDYSRYDWSIRQLPVVNVYEGETEEQTSRNAWLNGTIVMMALWPPNQRRSDLARVQMTFKGIVQNFFESEYLQEMLDELYWIQRPAKVPGLNEYGKQISWTPNVEGFVEDQQVPVSMINIRYRLDLRAWYRWLHFTDRTIASPFEETLSPLTLVGGFYEGVVDTSGDSQVQIPDEIPVSSPTSSLGVKKAKAK